MPPNPRVAKAFRAMKDIGISDDKVKPVLKSLLKLYDKNWELIEEENYRVLADAIFDNEEVQNAEKNKKLDNTERGHDSEGEAKEPEETERPLKRLRLKHQAGQGSQARDSSSSHLTGTLLIKPKDEPVELPDVQVENMSQSMVGTGHASIGDTRAESPNLTHHSLDRNKGKQPVSPSALMIQERSDTSELANVDKSQLNAPRRIESDVPQVMHLRNKGKEILTPQEASGGKNLDSKRSFHAIRIQEPVADREVMSSPKQKNTGDQELIKTTEDASGGKNLDTKRWSFHAIRIQDPVADCEVMSSPKQKNFGDQELIKPKEVACTDDLPFEVPLAVNLPDTSNKEESSKENNSTAEQDCEEPLALKSVSGKLRDESSSQLHIASSSSGEVKISFTCNFSPDGLNMHLPRLDEIITTVEDRCVSSYEVPPTKFSVMQLMKDMCECFVDLASNSRNGSKESTQVSPSIELLGNSSSAEPLVLKDTSFDAVNGLLGANSDAEVCNGLDVDRQPDTSVSHGNGFVYEESEQNGIHDLDSKSLIIVPQHQLTSDVITSNDDVYDLSKGQERVSISLFNDVNGAQPPFFHYIPQNAVFQNAYMNFSLARIGDDNCCLTCSGDCFSLSTPCACAHETGGEFAYTSEGLVKEEFLKECISMNRDPEKHCQFFCKECPLERSKNEDIIEPCKGHLVRKFIKECWSKCGCNKQCGNRVVQRGITRSLQVFMTERKGWGLRTLEDLPKGTFVCEYVGEVLTNAELFDRVSKSANVEEHSYPVLLDADWATEGVLKDEEALCLDATYYGNVARFINHRCFDSTLVEIPVEVETPDHHYYHLAFFTTRKVKAMEELTWDYGIDFDDLDHPVKAFSCQCGSRYCRNIKRTTRSRSSRK